jgi:glutamine synthetase
MTPPAHSLEAARAFLADHPEIQAIDVLVSDMNGIARGKRVRPKDLPKLFADGMPLIGSIFALDARGENVDAAGMALAQGDPDQILVPVDGRLLPTSWGKAPSAALLTTMRGKDGAPYFADPRQVLGAILARFAALGITPVVACELEFYLIDPARAADGGPQPPLSPLTGRRETMTQTYSADDLEAFQGFLSAVHEACAAQGVPAGGALSEYAPGQFEINLDHVPDALAAADHAILLKRAVRGVARAQGLDATFMAKPYARGTGSGLHIHVSLVDKTGRNLFSAEGGDTLLDQALGGLIHALPESVALFAPNANSYRRLAPGSYAPTKASWGYDNRSVALRVVGSGPDLRIEHRFAGADANPYLAMAAMLAGIHHGIVNKLSGGKPVATSGYESESGPSVPLRWAAALDRFEQGQIMPAYLGAEYHQLYAICRRGELEVFEAEADRREWDWYLPIL